MLAMLECSLPQRSFLPGDMLRGLVTLSFDPVAPTPKAWGYQAQDSWRIEVVGVLDGASKINGDEAKGLTRRADGGCMFLCADSSPCACVEGISAYYFSMCLPEVVPPTFRGPLS